MDNISIDFWATNLEPALPDLQTWMTQLDTRVAQTAARGGHMLTLPEFACAQWLSFAPLDLAPSLTMGWLADVGAGALDGVATIAAEHGVAILAGTIPHRTLAADGTPGFVNRAWLLTPDGSRYPQDKLSLTPVETQGAGGTTVHGDTINVIDWNGLRLAIVICLDAEFTHLWSRLGQMNLDLIIVPAKTDRITGYNRVFNCARARAIELQTIVCVVGAVGVPFGTALTDTGVGGAAVYTPCDVNVSLDGVFAHLPPQTADLMTDAVLTATHIPVGMCRRLRNGDSEAEICPALWNSDHLVISDPAETMSVRQPSLLAAK